MCNNSISIECSKRKFNEKIPVWTLSVIEMNEESSSFPPPTCVMGFTCVSKPELRLVRHFVTIKSWSNGNQMTSFHFHKGNQMTSFHFHLTLIPYHGPTTNPRVLGWSRTLCWWFDASRVPDIRRILMKRFQHNLCGASVLESVPFNKN